MLDDNFEIQEIGSKLDNLRKKFKTLAELRDAAVDKGLIDKSHLDQGLILLHTPIAEIEGIIEEAIKGILRTLGPEECGK